MTDFCAAGGLVGVSAAVVDRMDSVAGNVNNGSRVFKVGLKVDRRVKLDVGEIVVLVDAAVSAELADKRALDDTRGRVELETMDDDVALPIIPIELQTAQFGHGKQLD